MSYFQRRPKSLILPSKTQNIQRPSFKLAVNNVFEGRIHISKAEPWSLIIPAPFSLQFNSVLYLCLLAIHINITFALDCSPIFPSSPLHVFVLLFDYFLFYCFLTFKHFHCFSILLFVCSCVCWLFVCLSVQQSSFVAFGQIHHFSFILFSHMCLFVWLIH